MAPIVPGAPSGSRASVPVHPLLAPSSSRGRDGRVPSAIPVETGSIIRWRPVAMAMLVAGALIIELGLALGWVSTQRPTVVHGSAAMMVALAAIVSRVQFRSYRLYARCVVFCSIVLITALGSSFQGIITVPIYYVWPLLATAYLLGRAELVAFAALCVVGCFVAAAGDPRGPSLEVADYASVLVVGAVVVVTVRVLAENLGTTIGALRVTSQTDPLTGVLNRRSLQVGFNRAVELAEENGRPLTALVLDIDHFKAINDTHGHGTGDEALKRFADLLRDGCRASDLIARIGGEEFAVVMPGATPAQALERAELFASALRVDRSIPGIRLTTSGGIATYAPGTDTWESMLLAADEAVYRAKRSGRDRILMAHHIHATSAGSQAAESIPSAA